MQFKLSSSQTRIINGPIFKLMLNCPYTRATVQFENSVEQTVVGKQTFICPNETPWKRVVITVIAHCPVGVDVWYTNVQGDNLPIVEGAVNGAGGSFVVPTLVNGGAIGRFAVEGIGTRIDQFGTVTTPITQGRVFIQNWGPVDIEISVAQSFGIGHGLIIPASGGNLTVNLGGELWAKTIDGSNQVSPADTRVWTEFP